MIISMSQPCSQNWQEMLPTAQGNYCAHCQTTVIDFTQLSDSELWAALRKQGMSSGCGRFTPSQINRTILAPRQKWRLSSHIKPLFTWLLVAQSYLTTPLSARAQIKMEEVEQHREVATANNQITGFVLDYLTNKALGNITIRVAGTGISTQSDAIGAFVLPIPDSMVGRQVKLVAQYQGGSPFGATILSEDVTICADPLQNVITLYQYPLDESAQFSLTYRRPIVNHYGGYCVQITPAPEGKWTFNFWPFKRKKHKHD